MAEDLHGLGDRPAWRGHAPERQPAWAELEALAADRGAASLPALFAADPARAQRYTLSAAGVTLDYAKQRIDADILAALARLADQQGLAAARAAMYAGAALNVSEDRAAWHVALRRPADSPLCAEVHAVRAAMRAFTQAVRAGDWRGFDGRAITDVVNIGTGGSDLGPRLVCAALGRRGDGPRTHFVANADPADLDDVIGGLDAGTTLFVVTSKSLTTAETLANARAARRWLRAAGAHNGPDIARHFVAVTTDAAAAKAFGIDRVFGFWDWVGGRFSLWSAVGLTIALALGMDAFESLLAGAHAMDRHFANAPWSANLPALLALVGIWNRNFLGLSGHVVVPYAQRLGDLTAYLQQLEMESNGKSISRDGAPCAVATAPQIWGGVGTSAQHAFFQMLHQGGLTADVDFVLPLSRPAAAGDGRERQRVGNCLAQAEALMHGRGDAQASAPGRAVAARRFDGNRPSSMLLLESLDAACLGALLAAYEHKVFVQGVVWNINSFDQWGVELGKTLAGRIVAELEGGPDSAAHDASTAALIDRLWRRLGGTMTASNR